MRVPIVDVGNSKGIRIPQAILKQVLFGSEVDLDVTEGKIVLRKSNAPSVYPQFDSIAQLDDGTIQRMLRKINGPDLVTAMIGADEAVKEAIYRNLSARVKDYVKPRVERLEHGDARDILIERSRNVLSEALLEVSKE